MLRGRVVDLLSRKGMEELVRPTARDTLRLELLDVAERRDREPGGLRDVHFTEFLVQ